MPPKTRTRGQALTSAVTPTAPELVPDAAPAPAKKPRAKKVAGSDGEANNQDGTADADAAAADPNPTLAPAKQPKAKVARKRAAGGPAGAEADPDAAAAPAKKPKTEKPKTEKPKKAEKPKAEKVVIPDHIPQTPAPRQTQPAQAPSDDVPAVTTFTAVAWNVAGLRALLEKNPAMLQKIVAAEAPDVICMQEHKLQDVHVADVAAKLRILLPDYPTIHFAVSTAKKGYSGVAVLARAALPGAGSSPADDHTKTEKSKGQQGTLLGFVSRPPPAVPAAVPATAAAAVPAAPAAAPPQAAAVVPAAATVAPAPAAAVSAAAATNELLRITEGFGECAPGYLDEGRVITMEYTAFFLVLTYVPNSGQKLERLAYRLEQWDPAFRAYLTRLDAQKPVVIGGDLNVGHLDHDIYNVHAAHIKKSAGLTPQERASWSETLATAGQGGLVDTFRHFHPEAGGWFSYWSGRAGNRPFNKGLRIDGFAASKRMLTDVGSGGVKVVDGFILDQLTVGASDHAPIGVTFTL